MISQKLLAIIEKIDQNLQKKFLDQNLTLKEKVFGRTVKLNEEVGELCNEVLKYFGSQRDEKMLSELELKEEFADVLITTLLLAKSLDIDINEALQIKLDKIEKRGGI